MSKMEVKKYMRDGGVLTLRFGKIAYANKNRKANLAEVEFGWRKLSGNNEPYFTVTGNIWNQPQTDILCGGCSCQKTIAKYVHRNDILKKVIDFGDKYHLMNYSAVPKKDREAIDNLIWDIVEEYGVGK